MNTTSPQNNGNFSQTSTGTEPQGDNSSLFLLPTILCISIQLLGIMGNALVIHTISTQRRFQTNYYYLVYHLAVSDLSVLLFFGEETLRFCIPSLQLITSSVMCKLWTLPKAMFYSSGVVFLVLIGLLRYCGMFHPLKVHFSREKTRRVVFASYLGSLLISTPYAIAFNIKNNICQFVDHLYVFNVITSVLMFVFNFLAPVVLLHALYSKIIYRLWTQQRHRLTNPLLEPMTEASNNSSCEDQVKQRRVIRASLVSFAIVILFSSTSVCFEMFWLHATVRKSDAGKIPSWTFFVKIFGTCAVNPVIYGVADASLRQSFAQTFRNIVKCFKSNPCKCIGNSS